MSLSTSNLPYFTWTQFETSWPTQQDEDELKNSPRSRTLLLDELLRHIETPRDLCMRLLEEKGMPLTEDLHIKATQDFDTPDRSLPLTDQFDAADRAINLQRMKGINRSSQSMDNIPISLEPVMTSAPNVSSSKDWSSVSTARTTGRLQYFRHRIVNSDVLQSLKFEPLSMTNTLSFARVMVRRGTAMSRLRDMESSYGAWLMQHDTYWPIGSGNEYLNEMFWPDQLSSHVCALGMDHESKERGSLNCFSLSQNHSDRENDLMESLRPWETVASPRDSDNTTFADEILASPLSTNLAASLEKQANHGTVSSTMNRRVSLVPLSSQRLSPLSPMFIGYEGLMLRMPDIQLNSRAPFEVQTKDFAKEELSLPVRPAARLKCRHRNRAELDLRLRLINHGNIPDRLPQVSVAMLNEEVVVGDHCDEYILQEEVMGEDSDELYGMSSYEPQAPQVFTSTRNPPNRLYRPPTPYPHGFPISPAEPQGPATISCPSPSFSLLQRCIRHTSNSSTEPGTPTIVHYPSSFLPPPQRYDSLCSQPSSLEKLIDIDEETTDWTSQEHLKGVNMDIRNAMMVYLYSQHPLLDQRNGICHIRTLRPRRISHIKRVKSPLNRSNSHLQRPNSPFSFRKKEEDVIDVLNAVKPATNDDLLNRRYISEMRYKVRPARWTDVVKRKAKNWTWGFRKKVGRWEYP